MKSPEERALMTPEERVADYYSEKGQGAFLQHHDEPCKVCGLVYIKGHRCPGFVDVPLPPPAPPGNLKLGLVRGES